jgi:hypothetical protein
MKQRRLHALTVARIVRLIVTALLAAGCIGGATSLKGEIRDDGITLAADHVGSNVRLELRNTGTKSCDLVVALTSLPVDALPVLDAQVVITDGDGPGIVRPVKTYEEAPPFTIGHIEPGSTFSYEVALDSTPRSEERVLFCNSLGDYQHGRYALLRFDR